MHAENSPPPATREPPETPRKDNPTTKLARVFDLLSERDPTLNATLYEDAEFGGLLRDLYAALREQDNILSTVIERTIHQCALQRPSLSEEWSIDYQAIIRAAKAEVVTKAHGEKPCRVCGESTAGFTVQIRTDDDYLPQMHAGCVGVEEQYD